MKTPQQHSNRILLAVTGLSPQIVTETLYALCVIQDPAFIPTEVHILTTEEGAERARLNLLSKQGWFHRLRKDYHLPAIKFTADCIHVLEDVTGNRLSDIRTVEDNEQAANTITNKVREFTGKKDTALHVSIAGGRKTMGFYVGYALSLYGREQDRLSHVLVNSPYEQHPDFYYPTPYSRIIHTRFGNPKPMDTQEANVTLAEIPFVCLRHSLSKNSLERDTPFSVAVHAVQQEISPPRISINLQKQTLFCGGKEVVISTAPFAFYALFAIRKQKGYPAIHWTDANANEFLQLYAHITGEHHTRYAQAKKALINGFSKDAFDYRKTNINRLLQKELGARAKNYLLEGTGKRPLTRFEIAIPAERIDIIEKDKDISANKLTNHKLFRWKRV